MDVSTLLVQQMATLQRQVATLQALETTSMPLFNVRSWGATADLADHTAPIMEAIAELEATGGGTLYFPDPISYIVDSSVGLTNHAYSILIEGVNNVDIRGVPGSRLEFHNGSTGRPFIVRSCTTVRISGLEFSYERTDGASCDAINIQNCSDVAIWKNYIHHFPHYGILVCERTDNWGYRSTSGLSFSAATKRISDVNNGITGLSVGDIFLITGSLDNDARYTVAAIAPDNSYVQVNETLVDEAALSFKNLIIDSDISFDAGTKTITNPGGNGFTGLVEGQLIQVVGSTLNDDIYTIVDIDPGSFETVQVAETLHTEAAGATITIQTAAHPAFSQVLATACDNLVIMDNLIEHIGTIGIEVFPKVKSRNQIIAFNRLHDCGFPSRVGSGIKGGQAYTNSIIAFNQVDEGYIGIALGFGDTTYVFGNQITNFYTLAVANTLGTHPRFGGATMDLIVITQNQIAYTTKQGSITPATPDGVLFTSPVHVNAGANLNGISEADWTDPTAPIPITQFRGYYVVNNHFSNLPCTALGMVSTRTRMMNIFWEDNNIVDCALACSQSPITSQATVTDGSATITDITTWPAPVRNSTSGWYAGSGIFPMWWTTATYTISLPAGTTVVSIDPSTREMVLSNPISVIDNGTGLPVAAAQTLTRMSSDYPHGLSFIGNHIRNTGRAGNGTGVQRGNVHISSYNARILRNVVEGAGAYAFQVRGDGALIEGNDVFGHYANYDPAVIPAMTTTNAVVLLDQAGTYTLKNNHIHTKKGSLPAVSAFVNDNGAQSPGGSSTVVVYMDDSNTSMVGSLKPCIANQPVPLPRVGVLRNTPTSWDPNLIAAGANEVTTVTVSGARVGNKARATLSTATGGQWLIQATVTATNTVSVMLVNMSAAGINLGSGALDVEVFQV